MIDPVKPTTRLLEPATEQEIDDALGHDPLDYRHGFYAGVRWAEKLHNITENVKTE